MAKTSVKKSASAVKEAPAKFRRPKQDYTIQSVIHALDILEAFKGAAKEDLGVTELSESLSLHKNNVFRLLATLETRGYIEQNKTTGNYRLGIKTFEMGQVFLVQTGLIKQARPVMEEVLARCNETVYLAVLRNEKIVYMDIAETTHSVRVADRVGAVLPAYCTSVGKALLAYLSREELDKIFPKTKFEKFTDNTICERSELYSHLKEVAARGYALDLEEYEEEVFCVSAPVMDYTGKAVAAICVSGPGYRMGMERIIKELLPLTLKGAAEISKRLGHNAPEASK
jgi:IclR family transcriptional regulator, KDG regulon repressor